MIEKPKNGVTHPKNDLLKPQAAPRLGAAQGVASCGGGGRTTELQFLSCVQLCWDATKKTLGVVVEVRFCCQIRF